VPSNEPLPSLTSAMEDYLEAIYHLERERRIARVRDIAGRLGVKMSSVTSALKSLGARGFIRYDPHQFIELTERGMERAKQIVRKHEILKRFFTRVLNVDEASAEDNACRIEHNLDPAVMEKLVAFVEFIELCPIDRPKRQDKLPDGCDDCIPCLDKARKRVLSRVRAQKAALAEGLTMAEASPGAQVIVDTIKGSTKFKKALTEKGLETGAIVEIEKTDALLDLLTINVKGYHVPLARSDATKIFVKPL
jgi:DtxR family transcriptional regulator, Mn-dependent transcriptional regulator